MEFLQLESALWEPRNAKTSCGKTPKEVGIGVHVSLQKPDCFTLVHKDVERLETQNLELTSGGHAVCKVGVKVCLFQRRAETERWLFFPLRGVSLRVLRCG